MILRAAGKKLTRCNTSFFCSTPSRCKRRHAWKRQEAGDSCGFKALSKGNSYPPWLKLKHGTKQLVVCRCFSSSKRTYSGELAVGLRECSSNRWLRPGFCVDRVKPRLPHSLPKLMMVRRCNDEINACKRGISSSPSNKFWLKDSTKLFKSSIRKILYKQGYLIKEIYLKSK